MHNHLHTLQRLGYLRRDPTKPRAIEVRYDPWSGAAVERRPIRHVPLVGDVAAGTDVLAHENVEEMLPLPADFTGDGELFMLRVRGDSMIDAGILDGDFVVARQQETPTGRRRRGRHPGRGGHGQDVHARRGQDRAAAVQQPAAADGVRPRDVPIFGKVVTVLRRL